jgi:hypothetical protein
MRLYHSIVFMQGDEAAEVLPIIEHQGEQAAIDFLSQWDFGGESEHSPEPAPWGADDRLYRSGPYILSYSLRLGYVGLCRVADTPNEAAPGPRWFTQFVNLNPATT